MTVQSPMILERLLRDNDLGWLIDMYAPSERAIPFLLGQLDQLAAEFQNRFRYAVSFSPETLSVEAKRNPHKILAFLQALGVSGNLDMLVMVWRILQGLTIREVSMSYQELQTFHLRVTLCKSGQEADELETYDSRDINDAALLRHFGITMVDNQPLFDGFFPMRKK